MDFIWKLNVVVSAHAALLHIILISFVRLNESATIDDLRVACGIKYKGDKQDVFFDTVPENCTSIIMSCNDFPDEQTFYDMLKANQPNVPLFLIEDTVSFNAWLTEFDTISQCVNSYIDQIDKYNLDGIFFDNFYPEQITSDYSTNEVITNGIPKFFDAIREHYNCKNKDIILGIVFPWNPDVIKHGFSYEIIDDSVDAYLCNSTNYVKECPDTGGSLFSPCKLRETANQFYSFTDNLKYLTKSKIVMELQLYVKDAKYNTELSYEESCALCPGTVVCQDTLKSLYTKATIINDLQLAGAYIRYCNQDDNRGQCYCGHKAPFPGVAAIAAGIQGLDLEYKECLSFGVPGIYRPNDTCENSLTYPLSSLTESLSVSNKTDDFDVFILIFSPDSNPSEQESTKTSHEIESIHTLSTNPIV